MEDISLDTVGDELGFNAKYFSRKFKKASGLNFTSYITNVRMEMAAAELRSGSASIEQISSKFGFSSVQYFGRRFREIYGITPGEYRKASADTDPDVKSSETINPT